MTPMDAILFGLTTSGKALLVLAAAYALTRLMRDRSAAERHVVWMVASACVLLLPVMSLAGPRWRVGVITSQLSTGVSQAEQAIVAKPVPVRPAAASAPVARARPAVEVVPAPAPAPAARAAESVIPSPSAPDRSSMAPLLLLVWLAGVLAVGSRLLLGLARLHVLRRGARPLLDPVLLVRAHGIAAEMNLARPIQLLEGDQAAMPITFGVLRPTLLLPSSARSWSAARQSIVLRHELAHVRRRDSLSQLVAELGCALYWFNPLMWYAAYRMCAEREHACDDVVLQSGSRASDYAQELLEIAGSLRLRQVDAVAAIAMARRSHLRTRVVSLFDGRVRRERASTRLLVPAWIGAFLLVTPLSSLTLELTDPVPEAARADAEAPRARTAAGPWSAPAPRSPKDTPGAAAAILGAPVVTVRQQAQDCLARGQNTSVQSNTKNSRREIKWSGSDCSGEVLIEGDVSFDDRFTRITGISQGGQVRISTTEGGIARSVTIRPGNGGVAYEYALNGNRSDMDAAAQEWLSSTLLFMFRRLGFMADERARSILRNGGANALLVESEQLHGDYVRARYLEVLVAEGSLDAASLARVLDLAARDVDSDYYLAEVVTAAAVNNEFDDRARDAYLRAVGSIESDYYRYNVLSALLKEGGLSATQASTVVRASDRIGSDYYRAHLLEDVGKAYGSEAAVRAAYVDAARGIESDHHLASVLARLLTTVELVGPELERLLDAAASIESDYYLQSVLSKAAAHESLDDEALRALIDAASLIDSDHYQSELMIDIAKHHRLRGDVRSSFERLLESIESDTYRGRVASALLKNR
ncbi:MAG TPA: M56 family metallopeptidase [Longimicrobiales bacterium]